MRLPPAVIVHGIEDAGAALAPGAPVTLLSGDGAAGYAGAGWWRALILLARAEHPAADCADILDCGDAPGHALAALRLGQSLLILAPGCPALPRVRAIAESRGGRVLTARPPALDLARRGALRDLPRWLAHGDSGVDVS